MLDFNGDAIVLSGVTGTKLKSEILGEYYRLWWSITCGGKEKAYSNPTAIIELNAATGENFIEDTLEVVLGSSGHALQLKAEDPNTGLLKVVLVEEHPGCFSHLKKVIKKRWGSMTWTDRCDRHEKKDVYLLNTNLSDALEQLEKLGDLGNALFFFDPLLYTSWAHIEHVARKRIMQYYQTGTEFIVFLFTSDWVHGRGMMSSLPTSNDPSSWTTDQQKTVQDADSLFGHKEWRPRLLNHRTNDERIAVLVDLYRQRLHKWFRYIIPFPFAPKEGQLYHLFMCSNYERGIGITRSLYSTITGNRKYQPDNTSTYSKFISLHPEKKMKGASKCLEWKMLWAIIREHEEGLCDNYCKDLVTKDPNHIARHNALEWLASNGYIARTGKITDAWDNVPDSYRLNWDYLKSKLGVDAPGILQPLSNINMRNLS